MVLEKLIEKKDLDIYLEFRIKRLKINRRKHVELCQNENRREKIAMRFTGRIRELERLKSLLSEGKLKDECKQLWEEKETDSRILDRKICGARKKMLNGIAICDCEPGHKGQHFANEYIGKEETWWKG